MRVYSILAIMKIDVVADKLRIGFREKGNLRDKFHICSLYEFQSFDCCGVCMKGWKEEEEEEREKREKAGESARNPVGEDN